MGKVGGFLKSPRWKQRVAKIWKGMKKAGRFFKWSSWKRQGAKVGNAMGKACPGCSIGNVPGTLVRTPSGEYIRYSK